MTSKSLSWARGVLGIGATASEAEARTAYRLQVRRHHPDLNQNRGSVGASEAAMKELNEAWALVSDDLRNKRTPTPAVPPSPSPVQPKRATPRQRRSSFRPGRAQAADQAEELKKHIGRTLLQALAMVAFVGGTASVAGYAAEGLGFFDSMRSSLGMSHKGTIVPVHDESLFARGAHVTTQEDKDRLVLALLDGNTRLAEQILISGVDPNFVTKDGHTPLTIAIARQSDAQVELLLQHGADSGDGSMAALVKAVELNRIDYIRKLVGHGADPDERYGEGITALHMAPSPDVARVLLHLGADINDSNNGRRLSPLDAAIQNNKPAVATFLAQRGAKPSLTDRRESLSAGLSP